MQLGTIVRLLAIALGILSSLALARDGLGFKLFPFLDAVVTAYGILLDDLFLDIVLAIFDPLFNVLKAWFDWNWNLYPHWKHTFVLLWLFFAAEKQLPSGLRASLQKDSLIKQAYFALRRLGPSALTALVSATLAGTVAPDNPAMFWWPMTFWFLSLSIGHFFELANTPFERNSKGRPLTRWNKWALAKSRAGSGTVALVMGFSFASFALGFAEPIVIVGKPQGWWWGITAYLTYWMYFHRHGFWLTGRSGLATRIALLFGMISCALALGVLPEPEWLDFRQSRSPGLAGLAAYIAILAAWNLTYGAITGFHGSRERQLGLDVLSVLGGAATIVYVGYVLA